jgi:hypothetical protein
VGHRAVNCPKKSGANMDIGAVDSAGATAVGGVWEIAAVREAEWNEVKGPYKQNVQEQDRTICVARNRFAELEVGDDLEEGEAEECGECWPSPGDSRDMKAVKCKRFKGKVNMKGKDGQDIEDFASVCAVPFASCCVPPGLEYVEKLGIRAVETGWRKIGADEITIDSAAEESVCPRNWAVAFGTKEAGRKLKFINASGGEMGHYGERVASFRTMGESAVMSLTFQVSDVQKPLAAVRRISEKGNKVVFGPRVEDNYIENVATGRRIQMIKKGGSYVVPAELIMKEAAGFTGQAC